MMHTAAAPLATSDRKVDRLLAHYEESHRNPTNELIHYIAIPAIMLSIVGLLFASSSVGRLCFRGRQPRLLRAAARPGLPADDARCSPRWPWGWCMRWADLFCRFRPLSS
jgi:hypothetical protein